MLPHLSFIAEFSKAVSVCVVLLLLVLMMAYLSRVSVFPDIIPGGSSSVTWVHRQGISQQKMLLTPNPLQLQLNLKSPSTDTDSTVSLKIMSQCRCHCICWWGVEIRDLHSLLAWPWPSFRDAMLKPELRAMSGICLFSETPQSIEGSVDLELNVPNDLLNGSCLGAPQRHRCPLVITLLIIDDEGYQISVNSTPKVVALVSVIHVRDTLVPMATSILSQFLKQSNGQITTLQPLYVSGVSSEPRDQDQSSVPPTSEGPPQSDINCVVCHCNSATLALLPCRHACLCSHCLPRLSNCPLCRTHIHSYFYVLQANPSSPSNINIDSTSSSNSEVERDCASTELRIRNVSVPS